MLMGLRGEMPHTDFHNMDSRLSADASLGATVQDREAHLPSHSSPHSKKRHFTINSPELKRQVFQTEGIKYLQRQNKCILR